MDISKTADIEKVAICKRYFYIGLCFLPLVWLTNFLWFFPYAFRVASSPSQQEIKKYVILSGIGFSFWAIIVVAWETIFQSYRSLGLAWSDSLTLAYPIGRV